MRLAILLTTLLALGFAAPPRAGDDTKAAAVQSFMRKVHGKGGLAGRVYLLFRERSYKDAAELMRQWQAGADALAAKVPIKGDFASFRKRAEGYRVAVQSLRESISQENPKAVQAALAKVGATCKSCHAAHR